MGKTGRLNLEMRDWMQHQNKKMGSFGDKEILKSFEQAEKDTGTLPLNPAPADEFDKIWSRIQAERENLSESVPVSQTQHRRPWKKMMIVGVAAAILTIGGAFAAMGTKSYFYRDGRGINQGVVYNNDSKVVTVRDEEEAYEKISEELGVKTLRLGYMPNEMYFQDVMLGNGYGKIQYQYKNERIFFVQAKSNLAASQMYTSDAEESYSVWNPGLRMDIKVYEEKLSGNTITYEAQFTYNGVYYHLLSTTDKKEFDEMLKKIHF